MKKAGVCLTVTVLFFKCVPLQDVFSLCSLTKNDLGFQFYHSIITNLFLLISEASTMLPRKRSMLFTLTLLALVNYSEEYSSGAPSAVSEISVFV